ncbi:MAG: F0F1 ATP synthase subunit B [Erysipelotrichaceae bacterium]
MSINIDNYLRLNLVDMAIIFFSTLLIVFIAKKFFWNFVTSFLEKRKAIIKADLDNAKLQKEEAIKTKEEYAQQLLGIKEEAKQIIEVAKNNAKNEGKEIVENAKNEANLTLDKAMKSIELEKLQAKKEIKDQISDVAFTLTEKLLDKEIDQTTQKKFVQDFIQSAGNE